MKMREISREVDKKLLVNNNLKSSFVWHAYLMSPYEYVKKNGGKLKIKLYSLEVAAEEVIAKLVALKLYLDYGVIVDSKYIFSKGNNRLDKAIYNKIHKISSYFKTMLKECVEIIDRPMTPTNILKDVERYAIKNGKMEVDDEGNVNYTPNDPNETVIIIVDTVGNLKVEPHNGSVSVKTTIDLHSSNCRDIYRNQFGYTTVNVSHSNRNMANIQRARFGEIFPKMDDIKETNMLAQDANLVMALFDPMNHINANNNLHEFMNYNIPKLKNRFRAIGILKNREGENNKRVGLLYLGECGYFEELPQAEKVDDRVYNQIKSQQHYTALNITKKRKILESFSKEIDNVTNSENQSDKEES
jgi:hypothetical protein